jgi:glycosidase
MIYYGDEAGMWGAGDPCCRKPMVWDDLEYEPEVVLPDGNRRANPDTVEVNRDLLQTYQRLIRIRRQHPALSLGDFQTLLTDDERQIYAFRRGLEAQTVVVALNSADQPQQLELQAAGVAAWTDVLNGGAEQLPQDGKVRLQLAPRWGSVLVAGQPA